jgi:hypothetical protein
VYNKEQLAKTKKGKNQMQAQLAFEFVETDNPQIRELDKVLA